MAFIPIGVCKLITNVFYNPTFLNNYTFKLKNRIMQQS